MNTFWQVFLGALGGGGVLVALLAFFGKALFQQLLAKDLEKFKAELMREREQHGVVFTRMHEARSSAIAEIYRHAASLHDELKRITGFAKGGLPLDLQTSIKHFSALSTAFMHHRIWLSRALAEQLEKFEQTAKSSISNAILYSGTDMEEVAKADAGTFITMQTRLDVLIASLETEFRGVLGAEDKP